MNKIVSYLWSTKGIEYNLVNEDDVKNDVQRIYTYINPDYKNVLFIYWKSGAGGLFLANCLALSEKVYTLHPDLQSKVEYLNNSLEKQDLFWSDIYLSPPIVEYDTPEYIHQNKYTIIFDHDPTSVKLHLKHWNNLDVIYFKNQDLFCKIRRLLKNHDGILTKDSCEYIKKYDETIIPTSISKFKSLDNNIQDKLKNIFKSDENLNSFCFVKNKKIFYIWDTNWYFSEECTIIKIQQIYEYLNLPDFNEDVIRCYYRKWISKLDELRSQEIPKNIDDILNNKSYYDRPITSIPKNDLKPFI